MGSLPGRRGSPVFLKLLFSLCRQIADLDLQFCQLAFQWRQSSLGRFQEVWPDEGDVDMFRLARVFRDVEYPYMLMADHAPGHPDDRPIPGCSGHTTPAFAFQFGYIIALIQAVSAEA